MYFRGDVTVKDAEKAMQDGTRRVVRRRAMERLPDVGRFIDAGDPGVSGMARLEAIAGGEVP
ncbi:hypothetical protein CWS72_25495 [Telmatospirillum siberiense]|uniref:Uncharacterized protein n=1 Tax=Telmatospirillum siberiense TaxID=382514 RepID=A0A2N3PMR7_9PROT|nr:hypothetical protein CWS72_25495 [Telmatospirillum siberiense]